jgi:very-short-patch-repair endonuclease
MDELGLESALDTAIKLRLVSLEHISRYIERNGPANRKGVARLRRLLRDRTEGVPESELERRFLRVIRKARLPMPARQHRIGSRRIDFAYVEKRIAIELDGLADHRTKRIFEDDRRRQNDLVLDGWVVLRFTWDDVTKRSDDVIATIRRAIR